jgi:hypothetical protein
MWINRETWQSLLQLNEEGLEKAEGYPFTTFHTGVINPISLKVTPNVFGRNDNITWGGACPAFKKRAGLKNPAKFNREALRLGDVGSTKSTLWVRRPSSRHCARMIHSAQVQGGVS